MAKAGRKAPTERPNNQLLVDKVKEPNMGRVRMHHPGAANS